MPLKVSTETKRWAVKKVEEVGCLLSTPAPRANGISCPRLARSAPVHRLGLLCACARGGGGSCRRQGSAWGENLVGGLTPVGFGWTRRRSLLWQSRGCRRGSGSGRRTRSWWCTTSGGARWRPRSRRPWTSPTCASWRTTPRTYCPQGGASRSATSSRARRPSTSKGGARTAPRGPGTGRPRARRSPWR